MGMKTLHVAAYVNLSVFFLLNIFFVKKIWRESLYRNVIKPGNFVLAASAVSALTKIYCIQYIEPRDAIIISYTTPFCVMLFASIFLKEKLVLKYWLYGLLSMIGVCLYVYKKIAINNIYYAILMLHVLFKAIMHIGTKKASKNSIFAVLFYDNLFYSILAFIILSNSDSVNIVKFFDWRVFVMVSVTLVSLLSLTTSYNRAKDGITRLQNLDFAKIIFSFMFAVILLDDRIDTHEIYGVTIILTSIFLSHFNPKTFFIRKSSRA